MLDYEIWQSIVAIADRISSSRPCKKTRAITPHSNYVAQYIGIAALLKHIALRCVQGYRVSHGLDLRWKYVPLLVSSPPTAALMVIGTVVGGPRPPTTVPITIACEAPQALRRLEVVPRG
jgi:hypothetical protein